MRTKDYEESKRELENRKKQNDKKILINDERTRMSKVNQFEFKALKTLFLSFMGYLVLLGVSGYLVKQFNLGIFENVFSSISYTLVLIGSSLGIGTIFTKLIDKKYKVKERIKAFSNSKTEAEKIEEEIYYQIELEKVQNRNRAIDEAIKVINSNQEILNKVSNRYELNDRNVPENEEEAKQRKEELTTIINEKLNSLDLLTTKKVLQERFWRNREKFSRIEATMMTSMGCGLIAMVYGSFPKIVFQDIISIYGSFGGLISLAIGIVGGAMYMQKRNRDYKKAFDNLNLKLGDSALTDTIDKSYENTYQERQETEKLIDNLISDISLVEVQLQEQKRLQEQNRTTESHYQDLFAHDLELGTYGEDNLFAYNLELGEVEPVKEPILVKVRKKNKRNQ